MAGHHGREKRIDGKEGRMWKNVDEAQRGKEKDRRGWIS